MNTAFILTSDVLTLCHTAAMRFYWGADKSLARSGRKQARKHVRDERDFNNIQMRTVIKFLFLQDKVPKEIHAILTETLTCFLPGQTKDLSAPLYKSVLKEIHAILTETLALFPSWSDQGLISTAV